MIQSFWVRVFDDLVLHFTITTQCLHMDLARCHKQYLHLVVDTQSRPYCPLMTDRDCGAAYSSYLVLSIRSTDA